MLKAKKMDDLWQHRLGQSRGNSKVYAKAASYRIRAKLTYLAMNLYFQALLEKGKKPQGGGSFYQRYFGDRFFFSSKAKARPLPDSVVKMLWYFVPAKGELLGQAYRKGFYCFYTKRFIAELSRLIGDGPCLEVGAGNGVLSNFLTKAGCNMLATDDYSWQRSIIYPAIVEKIDAAAALKKYQPEIVLCSWPPAPNDFERVIFKSPSVRTYIVLGSRHEFATGDWNSYKNCAPFVMQPDTTLGSLLFPVDLDGMVAVFRRD